MSVDNRESWVESCQEAFDDDPMDYIRNDEGALGNFMDFLEANLHPDEFGRLVNGWLETKDGKKFAEQAVDKMIDNPPCDEEPRDG